MTVEKGSFEWAKLQHNYVEIPVEGLGCTWACLEDSRPLKYLPFNPESTCPYCLEAENG